MRGRSYDGGGTGVRTQTVHAHTRHTCVRRHIHAGADIRDHKDASCELHTQYTHTHTHREKSQLAAVTSAIGLQTVLRVKICPLRSVMFFYHQEGETIHIWDRWEWNGYLTLVSGQNSLLFNQSLITSFSIFIIIFNKAIGITHNMEMI